MVNPCRFRESRSFLFGSFSVAKKGGEKEQTTKCKRGTQEQNKERTKSEIKGIKHLMIWKTSDEKHFSSKTVINYYINAYTVARKCTLQNINSKCPFGWQWKKNDAKKAEHEAPKSKTLELLLYSWLSDIYSDGNICVENKKVDRSNDNNKLWINYKFF